MADLDQATLHRIFDYREGSLVSRVNRGYGNSRWFEGRVIGSRKRDGYIAFKYEKRSYLCHRAIWIYHNGPIPAHLIIDHINRVRDDNRVENLRLVTLKQNAENSKSRGYSYNRQIGKWVVRIGSDGDRRHYVGCFDSEEEARIARKKAEKNFYTHSTGK